MTGEGGATSAPPAIDHRTDKDPACGVHASNHEGLMITATRLEGT